MYVCVCESGHVFRNGLVWERKGSGVGGIDVCVRKGSAVRKGGITIGNDVDVCRAREKLFAGGKGVSVNNRRKRCKTKMMANN